MLDIGVDFLNFLSGSWVIKKKRRHVSVTLVVLVSFMQNFSRKSARLNGGCRFLEGRVAHEGTEA